MQTNRSDDTIAIFGGHHLTAHELRRAIHAYSGTEIIWEWRGPASGDHVAHHYDGRSPRSDTGCCQDYHAGVTLQPWSAVGGTSVVRHGDTPLAALEALLWHLVVPALLADEHGMPARAITPLGLV